MTSPLVSDVSVLTFCVCAEGESPLCSVASMATLTGAEEGEVGGGEEEAEDEGEEEEAVSPASMSESDLGLYVSSSILLTT